MKKIIVTGSSGFIGSSFIKKFRNKYEFLGIDPLKSGQNIKNFRSNLSNLDKINIKAGKDYFLHLGAVSHDKIFKIDPINSYKTNIISTINSIKLANKLNVKNFIFASTEWVYGENNTSKMLKETDPVNTENLSSDYASSKLLCEQLIKKAYKNRLIKNYIILRFGIIYGSRSRGCAVEGLFNEIYNDQDIRINGSLNNSKKYIHVDDLINAIEKSLKLKKNETLNLCGDRLYSLMDIINVSSKILNKKNIKIIKSNQKYLNTRNPSNLKIKKILNWKPKINLKKGIEKIFNEHYKTFK